MPSTPEEYAAAVRENVEKHGFHITFVGEDESPSFCYTTGICKTYGIPELFISSLPPGLSSDLMHSYVKRFATASPPQGRRIKAGNNPFDFYLIPVDMAKLSEYVLATAKYYNERPFEYLQEIFPDPDLRFPHERGYDYDQEILGNYSVIEKA